MWFLPTLAGLALAIVGHAALRRLAPSSNSLAAFVLVGGAVGMGVVTVEWLAWGATIESGAAIAAYAFGCELYIFLFSLINGSISAAVLHQLRTTTLSSAAIEDQFGGKAMVERRLAKMVAAGLLEPAPSGYRHTERGARLLWIYRYVRRFFWRTPLVPDIVTRTDPGPLVDVIGPRALHSLQRRLSHLLGLGATVLVPVLLFWPHLSREGVFIGDSDRLNHFLSILRFLTDGYREGRIHSWDPYVFGGFPLVPFTNPYPTSALALLWPPEQLFYAAGVVSCFLAVAAAASAYAFLRDLGVDSLPAGVGAALYVLCAFAILKISQNDISYSVIVLIPLGMLAIRRIRRDNLVRCYVALVLILTYLMTFAFLQKVAYAVLLFTAYAAFRSAATRTPRVVLVYVGAGASALVASFPRIYAMGEDFLRSARYLDTARPSFDTLWASSGFGLREGLRWFDDRLFGRYYSEVGALGNNFNLHEGLLLYMSTFATFFLLYGLVQHRRKVFAGPTSGAGDRLFFLIVAAAGFAVVLTKLGYYVVYLMFFKVEFIHSRIVITAMLPLTALIALFLDDELASDDRSRRTIPATMVVSSLGAAVAAAAAIEHVAGRFGARAVSVTFFSPAQPLHVLTGALWRVGLSLALLALLLGTARRWRARATLRSWALGMLAFLMVAQAFFYARPQIAGEHMRGQWPPFRTPTRLFAHADEFSVPTGEEVSRQGAVLETEEFRTSFVCPPDISGIYCPTHLAHFWRIRTIDGYLHAVPQRVARIPWGPGAISLRALTFTDIGRLPWGLLGLYNVRDAIVLSPELMTNTVRLSAGGTRHFRPEDLRVTRNPLPVAPRVFFVRTVTWVRDLEAASRALFPDHPGDKAYDPAAHSVAEGFSTDSAFAADGHVRARFDGDTVDVTFPSSPSSRFLVVNERYDPRWKAFAKDRALPVYPTNVLMRGVLVPPGVDHLTLRYVPATLAPGAWMCYGAAVTLVMLLVAWFRRLAAR
jgi:hypothetical protein